MKIEMTLNDVASAKLNPAVVKEAHDQVSKRLADVLDTKKGFEQKAFTLLAGYMTASLAVLGLAAVTYKDHNGLTAVAVALTICGACILAGATLFVLSLTDREYGSIGSSPNMWLRRGLIDGDDSALTKMLACIVYFHGKRIEDGIKQNNEKACLVRWGICLGVASPVVFCGALLILKTFLE